MTIRFLCLALLVGATSGCSSGYYEHTLRDNISYRAAADVGAVPELQSELRDRAAAILVDLAPRSFSGFAGDDADWVFEFESFVIAEDAPLRMSSMFWIDSGRADDDHHVLVRHGLVCIGATGESEAGSVIVGIDLEYRGPDRPSETVVEDGLRELRSAFFLAMAGELDRLARARGLRFEFRDWGETGPPILPALLGAGT